MLRLLPRALALATTAALLSACSSLDLSKPGSWIDTVAGGGTETGGEAKTAPPPPSAGDKPTVPPATQTASDQTTQGADASATPASAKAKPSLPSEQASAQPTEFPNLANQPDVQTPGTTESQRRDLRDSLVADRDKAQHSAEVLRGGTETPAAPPPPAKPADTTSTGGTTSSDTKPADGSASTPASTN